MWSNTDIAFPSPCLFRPPDIDDVHYRHCYRIDDFDRNTFRAVYTVRFTEVVYVLHAFQKKSKSGIATRKHDIELIRRRLQTAAAHHAANFSEG